MSIKVQYSTLIVKDLKESVRFYRDALGFSEGYHVDLPNNAQITIMQSPGGACVELIESTAYDIGTILEGDASEDHTMRFTIPN